MTPKEKARELRNKMYLKIPAVYDPTGLAHYPIAKELALIAVDEIIKVLYSLKFGNALSDEIEYYEQVKQEINNL